MPKSPVVDLDSLFSGAEQVHQLSQAEAEILRLREEIERLRSRGSDGLETQLATLREQLQSQSGFLYVPLASIQSNPSQPRQTFLDESIEAMSQSLEREGQLQPVILLEQDGNYLLFDGERRWRGAKLLGWEKLKSVVISRPIALHRQSLLTSLHRVRY